MKQQQPSAAMGVPVAEPNAPPFSPLNNHRGGNFSTGLCDCFSDPSLCCTSCWCPCITFGRIAEIVDRGSSSCGVAGSLYALLMACTGCHFIYSCTNRSKLKAQMGMPENNCEDCCIHYWCEPCALTQEYRELQHLGYDMALGWHGNVERAERQNNEAMRIPPLAPAGMTR